MAEWVPFAIKAATEIGKIFGKSEFLHQNTPPTDRYNGRFGTVEKQIREHRSELEGLSQRQRRTETLIAEHQAQNREMFAALQRENNALRDFLNAELQRLDARITDVDRFTIRNNITLQLFGAFNHDSDFIRKELLSDGFNQVLYRNANNTELPLNDLAMVVERFAEHLHVKLLSVNEELFEPAFRSKKYKVGQALLRFHSQLVYITALFYYP
jgi:hypothetical protein